MAGHDIIVVGASAGGVEALSTLVGDLDEDLPGSVFIVLHMGAHSATALPRILGRRTKLAVGRSKLKAAKPVPEQTVETLKEDVAWAKQRMS